MIRIEKYKFKKMKKNLFLFSFIFTIFYIPHSLASQEKDPEPRYVSKIVTNEDGKTYLEVEGKPFLYNSVQSWFPPGADYEIYMQKTAEVNYKVFCFWLLWAQLEPEEGKYDWSSIDRVIDLANKYDLRLDIVWGGSSFCGGMDPRFLPQWLMERDDLKVKNEYGQIALSRKGDRKSVV